MKQGLVAMRRRDETIWGYLEADQWRAWKRDVCLFTMLLHSDQDVPNGL